MYTYAELPPPTGSSATIRRASGRVRDGACASGLPLMCSVGARLVIVAIFLLFIRLQNCSDVYGTFSAGPQPMGKGKTTGKAKAPVSPSVTHASSAGPQSMGKGKRPDKGKAPIPAAIAHHVIVQGESYQLLNQYLQRSPMIMISDDPLGCQPGAPAPQTHRLDDRSRVFLFSVIDMIDDLVNSGVCLDDLGPENIAVISNGRPKLVGTSFIQRSSLSDVDVFKAKVSEIFLKLKTIVSRDILSGLPQSAELRHLLHLMGTNPCGMRFLINHHTATVPMENYLTLYFRLYNYVWDILRKKDPSGFLYVIENLEFDPLWRRDCAQNLHLQNYLDQKYDNFEPVASVHFHRKESKKIMRFHRNPPCHPLEYALDPSSADGMLYSQCAGLGSIFHGYFSRLTYSLMAGLQSIDCLKYVEIRSLFTNSLKTHVNIR